MDYPFGRHLQHHFWHSHLCVSFVSLSIHSGYLIGKILLCAFFVFLGIISLRTLATQERRDAVVVCTRLVHASALTHKDQNETQPLGLSCENIKTVGKPFLLIVCYILVYFLFFYICIREGLAAFSVGHLSFRPAQLFMAVSGFGSTFLFILIMVQLIWGAFFIKESCIFVLIKITSSLEVMPFIGTTVKMENQPSWTESKICSCTI